VKYNAGLVSVIYLRETSVLGYVVYLFDEEEPGKPPDEIAVVTIVVSRRVAFGEPNLPSTNFPVLVNSRARNLNLSRRIEASPRGF